MKDLQKFKTMIDALKSTNSRNFKMEILAKYPENKALLQIVMDPFQRFNVTKKSILTTQHVNSALPIPDSVESLIEILGKFATREISGNKALGICAMTMTKYSDFKDLLLCIFNKNLEIRIGDKEINKVWKGLIPTYDVCLAKSCDDKLLEKIRQEPEKWIIMRKLDGLRSACEYVGSEATSKSRNGNIFTSLQKVNLAIESMMAGFGTTGLVFDGEICVVDDEGNEDFSQAVSQVKRKDTEMEHPKYIIFDVITHKDFASKSGTLIYSERLKALKGFLAKQDSPYITMIEAVPFTDENFKSMKERCAKEGWEGLMLRKNVGYEGKRTKNLLKVKEFFTEEFVVMGHTNGPFRVINEKTGLEETIQTLSSVKIMYKNYYVEVGSGFSLAERKEFYEYPERIIGKTITVQYFEESKNKQGGLSLRFPTLKKIWENGRDV